MNAHAKATDATVDTSWLAAHRDDPAVCLVEVDVAASAYREGHIPGAVLWNVYADLRRPDYTPVGRAGLERLLSRSGIAPETTVVVYGYGAHLGYWLLESYGHADVRLVDGPRDRWVADGREWSIDEPAPAPAVYRLGPADPRLAAGLEDVAALAADPDAVVLDVRSQAEYDGERFWPSGATEDAGRAGHIPGAVHLPIDELRSADGRFRSRAELRDALQRRGIAAPGRVVTYCTIGNRAAQAWYALTALVGLPDVAVYEGSWAEWGKAADTPVER